MTLVIETGQDNQILRRKSEPIKTIDKKILRLLKEMEKSMKEEKGVGLAAPQVGRNVRMILVLLNNKNLIPMINPEIIDHSDKTEVGEEGCLSLPGIWGNVERYHEITVKYLDEKGTDRILKLEGFNARVVQHEIDHLNGILFTDYLDAEDSLLNVMNQRETERL
ncbi:peptide deformylase [Candidatus Peregrinibacteria bacterium]|nr:peptide deformylase [Candidatus Peregrinibacteria bacterium]